MKLFFFQMAGDLNRRLSQVRKLRAGNDGKKTLGVRGDLPEVFGQYMQFDTFHI